MKVSSLVDIIYIRLSTKLCLVNGYYVILTFCEIGEDVKL